MWKFVVLCLFVATLAACAAIKTHPVATVVAVAKGVGVTVKTLNQINNCEAKKDESGK